MSLSNTCCCSYATYFGPARTELSGRNPDNWTPGLGRGRDEKKVKTSKVQVTQQKPRQKSTCSHSALFDSRLLAIERHNNPSTLKGDEVQTTMECTKDIEGFKSDLRSFAACHNVAM